MKFSKIPFAKNNRFLTLPPANMPFMASSFQLLCVMSFTLHMRMEIKKFLICVKCTLKLLRYRHNCIKIHHILYLMSYWFLSKCFKKYINLYFIIVLLLFVKKDKIHNLYSNFSRKQLLRIWKDRELGQKISSFKKYISNNKNCLFWFS